MTKVSVAYKPAHWFVQQIRNHREIRETSAMKELNSLKLQLISKIFSKLFTQGAQTWLYFLNHSLLPTVSEDICYKIVLFILYRSSHQGCSVKKAVRNFKKVTGKHLCHSLFFNKVAGACNFNKKEALAQVFSCEFLEFSANSFFTEHLWSTASTLFHFLLPDVKFTLDKINSLDKALFLFLFICSPDDDFPNGSFIKI